MNIAFFLGAFPLVSETFIINQIVGLIERGHNVDIIAAREDKSETLHPDVEKYDLLNRTTYLGEFPGKKLDRYTKGLNIVANRIWHYPKEIIEALNVLKYGRSAISLRLLFAVNGMLTQKRSYDIIQCHFGVRGVQANLLRDLGLLNGKLITAIHGQETIGSMKKGGDNYRHLIRKGDLFLPISNLVAEWLRGGGVPENRIIVHHMGVDYDRYSKLDKITYGSGIIRLLSVCRLVEKKGVHYALDALSKVKGNYNNVHYDIVGDGPLRNELETLCKDLGLDMHVTFHGSKNSEEVREYLSRAEIFLGPSVTAADGDKEGIPVSLMEAMASGKAVISTYHAGIPELIQDRVSGLLVEERNSEQLANALTRLIGSERYRAELGKSGQKMIEEQYSIERLNNQLERIYWQMLGKKSNAIER
jgi:colanic acid/amylovoran biosynthesis glycosyltransferase